MKHFNYILIVLLFANITLQAQEKTFTILHTSDEHSALMPMPFLDYDAEKSNPAIGGFARLSNLINKIKTEKAQVQEPVLVLSSGDNIGGSPFSWLILQNLSPEIDLMNKIGYHATTIGNHEFDYGPDILAAYYKVGGYNKDNNPMSIIASNLEIPKDHPLQDIIIKENEIYKLENGLKIGIFGLIGEEAFKLATDAAPIGYLSDIEAAKKQVEYFKKNEVDVVIALTHSGDNADVDLAKKVDGIDLILGGHYHIKTDEPFEINNTFIFHPSYFVKYLGKYEFSYNSYSKKLTFKNRGNSLIKLTHDVGEDSLVASDVQNYLQALNKNIATISDSLFYNLNQVVLQSDFSLERIDFAEYGLGNFVVDAMRIVGEKVTGKPVDFAFQANGTIRADLVPGTMPWSKNKFSFFDIASVVPLGMGKDDIPGYPLVSVYATEEEVIRAVQITSMLHQIYGDIFFLQFSGLKYTYDPGKAFWMRVPFINLPIPANKAILSIDKYVGEGIQNTDEYKPMSKENDNLYHIVTDYYIASFLPMVGEILPQLKIVLKDENGNPYKHLDDAIIYSEGREYKVWQSAIEYALMFNEKGNLDNYYQTAQGRITKDEGVPLYLWTYSVLVALLLLIIFGISMLVKKLKSAKS